MAISQIVVRPCCSSIVSDDDHNLSSMMMMMMSCLVDSVGEEVANQSYSGL